MRKWKITRILFWSLVVTVFVFSTIGYSLAGKKWYDATYYGAQLFFMDYTEVEKSNVLLYLCRVLCPIMTATGMIALVRDFFRILTDGVVSKMNDATAIYYNTERLSVFGNGFRHPVFMGKKVNKTVKAHVLMFEEDIDNLTFYEKIEKDLAKGSKVYMKLEDVESKLLKKSKVYYFNIYEMISRAYWENRNLQKYFSNNEKNVKIAIIGFDALGQNLLDYGLMNNIYDLHQSIQYHIWGDSLLYRNLLGEFDMMNGDKIIYHDAEWKEEIEQLKDFDRIIIAQEADIEILQALLYLSGDAEIDYYNPNGTKLATVLEGGRITPFGILKNVLTEENIKTDKLYRAAKKINYNYIVKTDTTGTYTWTRPDVEDVMEDKWEELSGFHKGSNVACADYHKVRLLVMERMGADAADLSQEQLELLGEMEHIRWCRYHFVNHWHYAKERDNQKRQHNLLVPYREISADEKKKDLQTIKELLKD